jgi:hypothetical protein
MTPTPSRRTTTGRPSSPSTASCPSRSTSSRAPTPTPQLPNSVNIPADTVPVGVLTTKAGEYALPLDFNATAIQPLTVRFGPRSVVYDGTGGSTEVHNRGHIEDVAERTTTPVETVRDGDLDMLLHFASASSGLQPGDTEACAKGSFIDGATGRTYRFFGCDAVRVVQS